MGGPAAGVHLARHHLAAGQREQWPRERARQAHAAPSETVGLEGQVNAPGGTMVPTAMRLASRGVHRALGDLRTVR